MGQKIRFTISPFHFTMAISKDWIKGQPPHQTAARFGEDPDRPGWHGFGVWWGLFRGWVVISKRLDPGSQAGMTRFFWSVVVCFCLASTISPMVFPNLYPADPVDPVIRVLL